MNAIFYTLNNSAEARERGWGQRMGVDMNIDGELNINVVFDSDDN